MLQAVILSKKTLSQLGTTLTLYPQVLINVKTAKKIDLKTHANIQAAIAKAEHMLANTGRVLLRASGTEPKIRVMVEGEDQALVQQLAEDIAQVVTDATREV